MAADLQVSGGDTSVNVTVALRDSTTGQLKTGIAYGSVTYSYIRDGAASGATGTCITATKGTYADHGWVETDYAGLYQFGIPDAALAAGANGATVKLTASGCIDKTYRVLISPPATITVVVSDTGDESTIREIVSATLATTVKIDTAMEADGANYKFTAAALAEAGGGGSTDASEFTGAFSAEVLANAPTGATVIVTRTTVEASPELSIEVDRNYASSAAIPAEESQTGKSHKLSVYAKRGDTTALWSLGDANRVVSADGLTVTFSILGTSIATAGAYYYELANITNDKLICAGPFTVVNRGDTKA